MSEHSASPEAASCADSSECLEHLSLGLSSRQSELLKKQC